VTATPTILLLGEKGEVLFRQSGYKKGDEITLESRIAQALNIADTASVHIEISDTRPRRLSILLCRFSAPGLRKSMQSFDAIIVGQVRRTSWRGAWAQRAAWARSSNAACSADVREYRMYSHQDHG
jgi:hypothetical protein